jgi:SNF2 family DNA or RNA helicase
MLDELIKKYQSLDEDSRKVINLLALTHEGLNIDDIAKALPSINRNRFNVIIRHELNNKLLLKDNYNYSRYLTDVLMVIWLFPLICSKSEDIRAKKSAANYFFYSRGAYEMILKYLDALFFHPDKLKDAEKDLIYYNSNYIHCLWVVFAQPAYDKYIPNISEEIINIIYAVVLKATTLHLDSFNILQLIDDKIHNDKFVDLNCYRTEVAIIQGDFEQARKYTSLYRDQAHNYFVDAIFAFIDKNFDNAVILFERGLKKQRRIYKNKYLPVLPEITLFYLAACFMKGQDFYMPIFRKIMSEKGSIPNEAYVYFRQVCEYSIEDMERSKQIVSSITSTRDKVSEQILWRIIAIGFMDKASDMEIPIAQYIRKAVENKHYTLAYEAAYLLAKWYPNYIYQQLFNNIATKFNYKPALSCAKHPEEWEKQLNSYFSLEAIQMVMRKEVDNGKTRVAYRFFPDHIYAVPIFQTRNVVGGWTSGRNISIPNFVENKIDCMSEHDKRIASCESTYSYVLGKKAIVEMVGHSHVFLKDSAILVDLVAAQPIINVVKSSDKNYKIECDIKDIREGIIVRKETNTRYKVYSLTKFQCDIIKAISNSKPVPEEGREKLMQILKHFSAYVQVHSDFVVGEDDTQLRQVDTDSRIRIQLLPMGDGIKAELFVKPFGTHPPYCKPGRGGISLIATENDERVRVTRNLKDEKLYNERILNDIQSIENLRTADDGLMTFDNLFDALELLDILERHQDISIVEWPEGERLKIRKKITFNDLNLKIQSNINWFELEGKLKVDEDMILTISKLLELVRGSHGRFVELSNGEFLALSDQLRRRLSEIAAVTTESKDGVAINRFASASMMDVFDEFENISIDKAWHDFRKRLQTVQLSDVSVPSLMQAELRPYQVSGFQWMIRLSEWGAGACLADDMGLGKTVQAIAVLLHRAHCGAALVISPVSVMPNWISEVNRFAPTLNIKTLRNSDREATLASLEPGDLLIASYGLLLSEEKNISAKQWATVILDEAHAIKNYNTKTSKAAMSLQADFRVILTGTPIQNHLGEIWNLFQFINPGLLGSLSHFTDTFIRPDDEKARKRLKKLITPFILRRTKTAVLEELPPKTEIVRKITLSDEEVAFYEMLRRNAIAALENDDSPQGTKHLKVLAEITRLRQACCNPALVYPEVTIESTKLTTFLEIAAELKDNRHRALVFSQFVSHLSIVRKALDAAGYTYCYLDGSTALNKRESEVRSFQSGKGDFFLISLKAGGLGLNLTAADYVIHLDPWWNPAIEDQASDRAHRIGQTRPVTVYRLVAEQTIEEKIIQLHNTKRDLADSLLEGSDKSAKLSIDELMSLIRE